MTREEAIEELERLLSHWDDLENGKRSFRWYSKYAVGLALTALRGPAREMVERRAGEWVQEPNKGPAVFYCSSCGENFEIHSYEFQKYRFCPFCMAPMTDEAVQMVIKRLEEMRNGC